MWKPFDGLSIEKTYSFPTYLSRYSCQNTSAKCISMEMAWFLSECFEEKIAKCGKNARTAIPYTTGGTGRIV